jgi:phospholipid/cholesterol/gamma-HCH transport system permease protein
MSVMSTARPARILVNPVGWLGRSVLAVVSYSGGVTLLAFGALGSLLWPRRDRAQAAAAPGFWKTLMHQLFWMLMMGVPLVGMVHVAMGSFLSLQAYYGSTFVDGTGAVVGVGLLRNLGGLMTGLTFAGILSARMVPELHILSRRLTVAESPAIPLTMGGRRPAEEIDNIEPNVAPLIAPGRLAAPRIVAAGIACLLLSQWGVAVGTVVGWQASQSMMGLPTETFFMMMTKMMWLRDVVGLVVKGLLFGALPALICCYEGLGPGASEHEPASESISDSHPAHGLAPPWSTSAFRAVCLSCAAILVMNMSWFVLVYHAVPFYGPTLLTPQGP